MTEKIVLPPQEGPFSDVERIKEESNYLRGTLEKRWGIQSARVFQMMTTVL